jgi:hypothetical protein
VDGAGSEPLDGFVGGGFGLAAASVAVGVLMNVLSLVRVNVLSS